MFDESSQFNETSKYDQLYENAKEKDQQHIIHPDEPIIVCSLDDVKENLEGYYGRVKIFDDIIYLHPESDVHIIAKAMILVDINRSLPEQVQKSHFDASMVVPIFNKYACGSIHFKYPDFNFFKGYNIKNLVFVGEIVFRHETDKQIFLETIHYLTEYTPIQLVLVVQLPRHNFEEFGMKLILVHRDIEFDPNKREHLVSLLKKGEKKMNGCIKKDCPVNVLDWKNDQSYAALFNVKPIEVIEYNQEDFNLERPIKFQIPGSVFDYAEPILITIEFETIQKIKLEWEEHTTRFQ